MQVSVKMVDIFKIYKNNFVNYPANLEMNLDPLISIKESIVNEV